MLLRGCDTNLGGTGYASVRTTGTTALRPLEFRCQHISRYSIASAGHAQVNRSRIKPEAAVPFARAAVGGWLG